jgi:hypothetical protein
MASGKPAWPSLPCGIQLALQEYECDSQKPRDEIGDDLPVVAEMRMFVYILVSHLVFCL